jgi:hypothetical protein
MKKINFLVLLSFVALFSSCDDKAQMNYVYQNNLAGTWKVTEQGSMNSQGGLDYEVYHNDACGTDVDNMVFNEDLTFSQNDFSSATGTCQETSATGTYVQENHSLTLTQVDQYGTVHTTLITITKLDKTHLEFNYNQAGQLIFYKLEK